MRWGMEMGREYGRDSEAEVWRWEEVLERVGEILGVWKRNGVKYERVRE
jgi:hypothetical protein